MSKKLIFASGEEWLFDRPYFMGVINLTPDSFYEKSRVNSKKDLQKKVEQMVKEGVDILDIGGESSRPGSDSVDALEEIARVLPNISHIKKHFPTVKLSIDTTKGGVAKRVADLGVDIINDISSGRFSSFETATVAKEYGLPFVVMHMQGEPKTMQVSPSYPLGIMHDMRSFFDSQIAKLGKMGISNDKIILDPGIGFGKSLQDNIEIFRNIRELTGGKYPLLLGVSRKSMLGMITGEKIEQREISTEIAHVRAIEHGVNIIRTHDVKKSKNAWKVFSALSK